MKSKKVNENFTENVCQHFNQYTSEKTKKDRVFFNNLIPENDLTGEFQAEISYAQSIIIPHRYSLEQHGPFPTLVSHRDTLIILRPVIRLNDTDSIKLTVFDAEGHQLGIKYMDSPDKLPQHDGLIDDPIVYSDHTWSTVIPAYWVEPHIKLEFTHNKTHQGYLIVDRIGAPSKVVLYTIDVGMLTEPRNEFFFADNPALQKDYFQSLPLSQMIVSRYASLHLTKIVLPNGTIYTDRSPDLGGDHQGDMWTYICRFLISHGINMANYGRNYSSSTSASYPGLLNQMIIHTAIGNYLNGKVIHGLAAIPNASTAVLHKTIGNELSHEIGHIFTLGHAPGGSKGSIHRHAGDINSTWGYNRPLHRFITNFYWDQTGDQSMGSTNPDPDDDAIVSPFENYKMKRDPMWHANVSGHISNYTLYTPYSSHVIQKDFLEKNATFSPKSPTGFKKWNPETKKMEHFIVNIPNYLSDLTLESQEALDLIKEDTEGLYLKEQFNHHPSIEIHTKNGSWIRDIYLPSGAEVGLHKEILISRNSAYGVAVHYNGTKFEMGANSQLSLQSDGTLWVNHLIEHNRPVYYGIPVVTILGYYDPERELDSYLYPALFSQYGHTYSPNKNISSKSCFLRVYTKNRGVMEYRLTNSTLDSGYMNKLHVNVPQSTQPYKAEIIDKEVVLSSIDIHEPTNFDFAYAVNGIKTDTTLVLDTNKDIMQIENSAHGLSMYFQEHCTVHVILNEGSSVMGFNLPKFVLDGQKFVVTVYTHDADISYNENDRWRIRRNETQAFVFQDGLWEAI